jgi:hypothetical protein
VLVRECGNKLGITNQFVRLVVRPRADVQRLMAGLYGYFGVQTSSPSEASALGGYPDSASSLFGSYPETAGALTSGQFPPSGTGSSTLPSSPEPYSPSLTGSWSTTLPTTPYP